VAAELVEVRPLDRLGGQCCVAAELVEVWALDRLGERVVRGWGAAAELVEVRPLGERIEWGPDGD
jgi:hypothetical protein